MTNRSFVLSVITSGLLLFFFVLSNIIGQPQIAFVIVAGLHLGFAIWLKATKGCKPSVKHNKISHPLLTTGQK